MIQIDSMSRKPVYEQIIDQLERFILSGVLHEGDQIASVRALSLDQSINPRTVLKAYTDLDIRGVIRSVPGKGYFVSPGATEVLLRSRRARTKEFLALAEELAIAGVPKDELLRILDCAYHDTGADGRPAAASPRNKK